MLRQVPMATVICTMCIMINLACEFMSISLPARMACSKPLLPAAGRCVPFGHAGLHDSLRQRAGVNEAGTGKIRRLATACLPGNALHSAQYWSSDADQV